MDTKDLGLDTIYWSYIRNVPMWEGNRYEITETKLGGYRLWDAETDTQIKVLDTFAEAKQEAELHKQRLAVSA